MNKKILIILPAVFALSSCTESGKIINFFSFDSEEEKIEHDYVEISEYKINWEEIFQVQRDNYFAYFYSLTCGHCKNLKNSVIEYALKNKNLYFLEANEKIVIEKDVTHSIGAVSIEEMAILGYPSLINIQQGVCVFNVAGEKEIISKLNL